MSVIGLVCEFNPFHNGHKYLIDSIKGKNDIVVAVMSGNFVQRGEPAVFPKEIRTMAALLSGVDIVLELPFVYATASAEFFAFNAVKILSDFGCDKIAFGTENADVSSLVKAAETITKDDFDKEVQEFYASGISFPAARQMALDKYNICCDISTPNNILAIEYIKAIKKLDSKLEILTVNRKGAGYNDNFSIGEFASATYIRDLIRKKESFKSFVPENLFSLYSNAIENGNFLSEYKFELSALGVLRSKLSDDFSAIANISEGLDNRIKTAINNHNSLEELYDEIKTKRYTYTRVKRAVLSVILDVKSVDLQILPPYCRVLGFNTKISGVMGDLAKNSKIPFVASYSDIVKLQNSEADRVFELENKSTDIYNLILNSSGICSKEKTFSPIKV